MDAFLQDIKAREHLFGHTDYVPDMFPFQGLHHDLARQASDANLKEALLEYQYPYKESELLADNKYSPDIRLQVLALDKKFSNHG